MKRAFAVLVIALAGCSNDPDGFSHDNHGYGWHYDATGSTGTRLRFRNPVIGPGDLFASDISLYDRAFTEAQECTGLTAPGPLIVMVQFDGLGRLPDGTRVAGRYYRNPSLIILADGFAVKHEMIHYLLDHATGNMSADHSSPLFSDCQLFSV